MSPTRPAAAELAAAVAGELAPHAVPDGCWPSGAVLIATASPV